MEVIFGFGFVPFIILVVCFMIINSKSQSDSTKKRFARFLLYATVILPAGIAILVLPFLLYDESYYAYQSIYELYRSIFIGTVQVALGITCFLGGYLKWNNFSNMNSPVAKRLFFWWDEFSNKPFGSYISNEEYRQFCIIVGLVVIYTGLLIIAFPILKLILH